MTCNLCGHPNEVGEEYFAPIDPSGVRVDRLQRPELTLGTCEFLVPKEYWSKEPVGMRYLFLIDASAESCNRGFLQGVCDGILSALYGDDVDDEETDDEEETNGETVPKPSKVPAGAKVGFMTFDRDIHFYNVSSSLPAAQQLVMSDLEEPFSVISAEHLFVDAVESKSNIMSLLKSIPRMFFNIRHAEPTLLPSLQASLSALEASGGKIICSLGSLPTYGPGRLQLRDKGQTQNDDNEHNRNLLKTEHPLFKKVQADLVKAGVGVDFLLSAPSGGYLDISTIGLVAEKTGGETYYYANWSYPRDLLRLEKEISHCVQREQGYAALMKVRCSNGLQIAHYSGNFTQHTFGADLELASVTEDSGMCVTFAYDGKVSFLLNPAASAEERRRATRVEVRFCRRSQEVETRADCDVTARFQIRRPLSIRSVVYYDFWPASSPLQQYRRFCHGDSAREYAVCGPRCYHWCSCQGERRQSDRKTIEGYPTSNSRQIYRHPRRLPEALLWIASTGPASPPRESERVCHVRARSSQVARIEGRT